jgi:hypothetical protein
MRGAGVAQAASNRAPGRFIAPGEDGPSALRGQALDAGPADAVRAASDDDHGRAGWREATISPAANARITSPMATGVE